MLGNTVVLGIEQQKLLATWITKTTMVDQYYNDSKEISIPSSDLQYLMDKLSPPPNWSIIITNYIGSEWHMRIYRYYVYLKDLREGSVIDPMPYNAQATTFGIGRLLMHSVQEASLGLQFKDQHNGLYRIWPTQENPIVFPFPQVLTDVHATSLATAFYRTLTDRGIRLPPFPEGH